MNVRRLVHSAISKVELSAAVVSYRAAKLIGASPSLNAIANFHASDKGSLHGYEGRFGRGHGYTRIYRELFSKLRHEEITLLEVGIGVEGPGSFGSTVFGRNTGGASLKTWFDYFPRARIFGVDLNTATFLDNDRIKTFAADQSDITSLKVVLDEIGGLIDVVIDDGSHASRHQQATLATLFPRLARGGIYVVEDLHWQPDWIERETDLKTATLLQRYIDTGVLSSPFMARQESEEIGRQIDRCVVLRRRSGVPRVAVVHKK